MRGLKSGETRGLLILWCNDIFYIITKTMWLFLQKKEYVITVIFFETLITLLFQFTENRNLPKVTLDRD